MNLKVLGTPAPPRAGVNGFMASRCEPPPSRNDADAATFLRRGKRIYSEQMRGVARVRKAERTSRT